MSTQKWRRSIATPILAVLASLLTAANALSCLKPLGVFGSMNEPEPTVGLTGGLFRLELNELAKGDEPYEQSSLGVPLLVYYGRWQNSVHVVRLYHVDPLNGWCIGVNLWPVAAAAWIVPIRAGFGALRRRRRGMLGLCPSCGYNLTGNLSGRCPECGTSFT
ncbi:hypothetical protein RAS1_33390 [Phycisphaerae bacterium RAS1]|nr:hypothetical protein RAS1_33390 [Phycisphaerae bacterium RAS1]